MVKGAKKLFIGAIHKALKRTRLYSKKELGKMLGMAVSRKFSLGMSV